MSDCERATHLGKSQIVTDRQSDIKRVDLATDKLITGRKTRSLVQRSSRNQMSLTIFGNDFAAGIDKHLRVVNGFPAAI